MKVAQTEAIQFGRWLLKHAEGVFDGEGLLTWKYGSEMLDTHELYAIYNHEKGNKRYRCLLCGRDKFTQKTSHYCVGGYRKRGLKWEEVE